MTTDEFSPLIYQAKEEIAKIQIQRHTLDADQNPRPSADKVSSIKDPEKKAKPGICKGTTWAEKAIIFYIGLVNFLNFLSNSTASPFLARVVLQKGGTVILSSFLLEISMVTMAVSSLLIAKYQSRIGCRKLILSGQSLFALCQVCFGAIGFFENLLGFVIVGATLRAIQGVCQAALVVGGLTVVCQEFPNFISIVFGIIEAAYGVGDLTGPYLGGYLYDTSGGMMLPMAVTGAVTLLFSLLGIKMLQKVDDYKSQDSTNSYLKMVIGNPKAVLVIGLSSIVAGAFTLCDATITVYLQSLGYSATKAGQLLFLMGISYCVFSFIVGWAITTRKGYRRVSIAIGLLGALASPLVFWSGQTDPWVYTAGFGFAMFVALAFIPALDELLYLIEASCDDVRLDGNMSLNSAVSGLWSATVALGNFIVPLLGSAFEMVLPFSVSFSLSLLSGYLFIFLLVAIVMLYKQISGRRL